MPHSFQTMSLENLTFLVVVISAFVVFAVSLFGTWVYLNISDRAPGRQAVVSPAVRPSESVASHVEPEHRQAA